MHNLISMAETNPVLELLKVGTGQSTGQVPGNASCGQFAVFNRRGGVICSQIFVVVQFVFVPSRSKFNLILIG